MPKIRADAHVALSPALPEVTTEIFTSATAIVGIRGSGKTNTGVVIAEQAVSHGVPPAIIDPTGVWYGLKSSRDGRSPGLPVYVFGGQHGDVPLDPDAGAIVARFVVDERVPVVLDLSDMSKTKQRRFVGAYCEALYDLKARKREPVLLIIDEVARFCPQMLQRGDVELARCVGAVEDIGSLGRSRGLGLTIIGQRPATINKNVLTQADNLIAMRTVGTQDRNAINEWIVAAQGDEEQGDQLVRDIASLPQGEGYFWSPAIFSLFRRVRFAARETFDSSRTPKVGEKPIEPKAFASIDLDRLRGDMAAAVEAVRADDPKTLRARIAELERTQKSGADPAEVQHLRARIAELEARPALTPIAPLSERDLQHLDLVARRFEGALQRFDRLGVQVEAARNDLSEALTDALQRLEAVREAVSSRVPSAAVSPVVPSRAAARPARAPEPKTATPPRGSAATDSAGSIAGGPRKVLVALAGVRDGRATRVQLGVLAGYSPSAGGFRNNLSALRQAGLITDDGSAVVITAAGRAEAGDVRASVTTADVHALWRSKLDGGPRKVLDVLLEVYPRALTREDLAARAGYVASAGGFRNNLSALRTTDLLVERDREISASPALFPTGKLR